MSEPSNPYAAPADLGVARESDGSAAPDYRPVIRCRGHHRPADCWMAFNRTNLMARARRLLSAETFAVTFCFVMLLIMLGFDVVTGQRILPFWFFFLGTALTPVWWSVLNWITEWRLAAQLSRRQHFQEERAYAARLDTGGLTVMTPTAFVRAAWPFFSGVNLQADRIELPMFENTHRFILPTRFFASADEYHDAQRLIADQLNMPEGCPPRADVEGQPYSVGNEPWPQQIDEALQWSAERWPFDSGHQRISFSYAWKPQPRTAAQLGAEIRAVTKGILTSTLPLALSLPIWLMYDYLFHGSWGFLNETPVASLFYLIPTLTLLMIATWLLLRGYLHSTQRRTTPTHTAVSDTGYAVINEDYAVWFRWETEVRNVSTDTVIGWKEADREFGWRRDLLDSDVAARLEQLLQQVTEQTTGKPSRDT